MFGLDRVRLLAPLLLLTVLAPPAASAQEPSTPQIHQYGPQFDNMPHIEISPFVGWRFGGTIRDNNTGATYRLEPNWSHGLSLDFPVADDFRVEFRYTRQRTFVNAPADTGAAALDRLPNPA